MRQLICAGVVALALLCVARPALAGGEAAVPALKHSEKLITVKAWKEVGEGELDYLKRATAKHFMVAGPNGTIVTEYGSFHDNAGLRFTNPAVKSRKPAHPAFAGSERTS